MDTLGTCRVSVAHRRGLAGLLKRHVADRSKNTRPSVVPQGYLSCREACRATLAPSTPDYLNRDGLDCGVRRIAGRPRSIARVFTPNRRANLRRVIGFRARAQARSRRRTPRQSERAAPSGGVPSSSVRRLTPRRMKHGRLRWGLARRSATPFVLGARRQVGPGAGAAPHTVSTRESSHRFAPEHAL